MKSALVFVMLAAVGLSGCAADLPGMEPSAGAAHSHGDHEHADGAAHGDGHDAAHDASGMGHDGHAQTGMERPEFGQAQGRIPSAADAEAFEQVRSLRIVGDEAFKPATGVRSGSGSMEDPFVIEHWYVTGDLYIQDTDACFEIREVWVGGQLSLNWNGLCAWVHHSYIHDLRVNENIRRDGYATGGFIEHNDIGYVGQLRHYDGVFRFNEVGPMPATAPWDPVLETVPFGFAQDPRVANIDGFNQGRIEHNTFHGSVDLDYHGHHHGTGFFAPHSHYHGDNDTRGMAHDHTQRWTSVAFVGNTIIDHEGYGLRYDDRNHAGDDRVAASEQEKTLDLDHVHRSRIDILQNRLEGAGIWVDIFNADDAHHKERNDGWLTIADNEVHLVGRDQGPFGLWGAGHDAHTAIRVFTAKEVDLRVTGNRMTFKAGEDDGPLAILSPVAYPTALAIDGFRDAHALVADNTATGFHTGIDAGRFEAASWTLLANDFGDVEVPMSADDSVPMPEGE